MTESATSPTTVPPAPENTAATEDGAETTDTMPEDLTVPAEPSDALEPDQQAPDADIPEPDQSPGTGDETVAQVSDDDSETPAKSSEAENQTPDDEAEMPATASGAETQATEDEAEMTDAADETEDPTSEDDEAEDPESDEAPEYDDAPDAEDDVQQEPISPAEQVTKIFIWVRKGLATVGVQETGTDPEFATIASHDLDEIIPTIPGIVRAAQEKWLTEPHRKPAAPAPAARPRPASATRRVANNQNTPKTAAPQLF